MNCKARFLGVVLGLLVVNQGCKNAVKDSEVDLPIPRELVLVETMRIDGHDEILGVINNPVVGSNGLIAVDQSQAGSIRFFDSGGVPVGSFGRRGQGPGEFNGVMKIGWSGDILWAWDRVQRRITAIDPFQVIGAQTEQVARVASPMLHDADTIPEFRQVEVNARFPDGTIHAQVGNPQGPAAPLFEGMFAHVRMSADGTILDIIAKYPNIPEDVLIRTNDSAFGVGLPWVVRPITAVAGDGSRTAIITPHVSGPESETIHVLMLGATGDTIYSTRVPFRGAAIPREIADSAVASRMALAATMNRELEVAFKERVTVPPMYPPLSRRTVIGSNGFLAFELTDSIGSMSFQYRVLDPQGREVGQITQRRGTIVAIEEGAVWTVEPDALHVQSLVRYAIEPAR